MSPDRREISRVRSTLQEISPAVHQRGTWPTPGRLAKLPPLQAQTEMDKLVMQNDYVVFGKIKGMCFSVRWNI